MADNNVSTPRSFVSLTDFYINDYHNLVYKKYPSYQPSLYVEYYSLDISYSNFDENFKSFYKNVNDQNFGGKYNRIHNFPILTSTSVMYDNTANEKGINTQDSSELNFIIDPTFDFLIKPGDIIKFKINDDYFGFYVITNIDDSATLEHSYHRATSKLIVGITQEKINKFVCNESIFIQEYHKIYSKEVAVLILTIEGKLPEYIEKLNSMYKINLDFHIFEDNETIITSFDRAIKIMYDMYQAHIRMDSLKLSYSYDVNFYEKEPITPYDLLINPSDDNYYKRFKELIQFNSIRETAQMKSHKYYSSDRSYDNIFYHNYNTVDDYVCSSLFLAPDMLSDNFWVMFDNWIAALVQKDESLFSNDLVNYNQRLYKLMMGWLEILITKNYLTNQKECTIKYFNEMSENATLLETGILISQLLYITYYFKSEHDYVVNFKDSRK